jgi:predicted nucleotidyltransferase
MLTSLLMTTADLPIAIDHELIARFCRERGIRALSLFGSVLRDDFDPEKSDIDVLAEFAPGALRGVGLQYFTFAEELGAILRHKVDFCSQLHPAFRDRVGRESVKLYEQP